MTNYPQQPLTGTNRGMGENPLSDPGIRMILSISPLDGSLRPLPQDLSIQELANGSMRISYPDGSVRELIPGAEGEGRMITTLADGARIQSDLSMGEGQVTLASISSTGEKSFLSLNENGANMQRITPGGTVFNVIPESASELVQSFREAEAFAQAEELRQDEQFLANQEFGEWNNFGKPAEWQPEQNWQPPEQNWQPEQNFQQTQHFAPQFEYGVHQPPSFMPSQGVWQPDQNFQQAQHFAPQFEYGVEEGVQEGVHQFHYPTWLASQGNWQPDQNFQQAQHFAPQFEYGVEEGVQEGVHQFHYPTWLASQGNWQPDQNFQQAQHFAPQFEEGVHQYPSFMPPQGDWQPPAVHGFAPAPFTDASGFPVKDSTGIAFAGGPQAFDGQMSNVAFGELAPEAEFGFDTSTQEQTPQ